MNFMKQVRFSTVIANDQECKFLLVSRLVKREFVAFKVYIVSVEIIKSFQCCFSRNYQVVSVFRAH